LELDHVSENGGAVPYGSSRRDLYHENNLLIVVSFCWQI
jgi:hypothetical protein